MKQTNLKTRLIDDEQVFENLPGNEAGIMTSSGEGGCDGCGCGFGWSDRGIEVLNSNNDVSVRVDGYDWIASGNINWAATARAVSASESITDYLIEGSANCGLRLDGCNKSTLNNKGGISTTSGTVITLSNSNASGYVHETSIGTSLKLELRSNAGRGHFIVVRCDYDSYGREYDSQTLVDVVKDLRLLFTIEFDPVGETFTLSEVKIEAV